MSVREDIINIATYFFDVLIRKFLDLENTIHKQSGLLSIFRKINYADRANAFNGLSERAIEINEALSKIELSKEQYDLYNLATKLSECIAIYINMVKSQIEINTYLNQKANGEKYAWDEYSRSQKFFDMLRGSLEVELPKLQSLYRLVLECKNKHETQKEIKKSHFITAHVLDPLYYAANPQSPIKYENWEIGSNISHESYEKFKGDDGEIYIVNVYEEGKLVQLIVTKEIWTVTEQKYNFI